MENVTYRIRRLTQLYGWGRSKTYKLIAEGELEAVKVGRCTMITKRSADALVARGIAAAKLQWGQG